MAKETTKASATEAEAVRLYRAGAPAETTDLPLLREQYLEIILDGVAVARLLCTGSYLLELALGWLLTEGHIHCVDDLAALDFGTTASGLQIRARRKAILSPASSSNPGVFSWRADWIYTYAACFAQDTPLHRETRSTHSCFLYRGSEFLFAVEDIGRHNAVDKAVGHALLRGLDLRQCILFTSGRVPTDMARKAIQAGVPLLVSKGPATAEAVALARRTGLSLIGWVKRDSFQLYAGKEPEESS